MHILTRIFGALLLICGLTAGAAKFMHYRPGVQASQIPVESAPELDPSALDGAIVIFAGGLLVLHERRRKRQ